MAAYSLQGAAPQLRPPDTSARGGKGWRRCSRLHQLHPPRLGRAEGGGPVAVKRGLQGVAHPRTAPGCPSARPAACAGQGSSLSAAGREATAQIRHPRDDKVRTLDALLEARPASLQLQPCAVLVLRAKPDPGGRSGRPGQSAAPSPPWNTRALAPSGRAPPSSSGAVEPSSGSGRSGSPMGTWRAGWGKGRW